MSGPPNTLQGWRTALHKAAAVPKDSPDYEEAQGVKAEALARIGDLERQGIVSEAPRDPNAALAFGAGLAQSLSAGTGEPISGLASALTGGTFRQGASKYRQGLENLTAGHPYAELAGEGTGILAPGVVGSIAPAGSTLRSALGLTGSAVPVSQDLLTGTAARVLKSAGTGAALGGLSGFSSGGDDPGDIGARLREGVEGSVLGGLLTGGTAALGTGARSQSLERSLQRARLATGLQRDEAGIRDMAARTALNEARLEDLQQRMERGSAAPPASPAPEARLPGGLSESAVRASLAKQGFPTDAIDRVIAKLRAGELPTGTMPADPQPISEGPPGSNKLRPGESASTQVRSGTATNPDVQHTEVSVTGRRATPMPPTEPTILEMQEGRIPQQPGLRGPGGSQRWSTTQIGAPGLDLSSTASETQLKMLKQLSPEQLREALKNPFFAQLAKALGVQ